MIHPEFEFVGSRPSSYDPPEFETLLPSLQAHCQVR